MSFQLIDLLPIALLALFVFQSKRVPKAEGLNPDYLSISTGRSLRGAMAILVVYHHLAQKITEGLLFPPFTRFGLLPVSVFFFLSGYGLQKSHMKSERYHKGFVLRRIPQVLFPYLIVIALFWLMYAADGQIYSIKDIALTFVKGDPIVTYSWYIVNILIFYAAYWLLMVICKKKYLMMILGAVLWFGAYVVFCKKMGYPSYWFSSSHLLICGMIWAVYEEKILEFIKKRYLLLSVCSSVLFLALFIIKIEFEQVIPTKALPLLLTMTVSVLFVLCVILYSLRIRFGNRILAFLGNCSLEIYLIQGLFIVGLRSNIVTIENDFLWSLLTVAGSIALGFILHIVFSALLKGYRRLLKID